MFCKHIKYEADLIEAVELSEKYRDETCLIGEPNKFIVEKIRKDLNGLDLRNLKHNDSKVTNKLYTINNKKKEIN